MSQLMQPMLLLKMLVHSSQKGCSLPVDLAGPRASVEGGNYSNIYSGKSQTS